MSNADTRKHQMRVMNLLCEVARELLVRGRTHDDSKLKEPEKSIFDEFTPKLKGSTYGSEEYKGFLASMKPALDHHYAHNRHHPEHFCWQCAICGGVFSSEEAPEVDWGDQKHRFCPRCMPHDNSSVVWEAELLHRSDGGIEGMTLIDLIEMLCDWKAASERHADGDVIKSIEINTGRFQIGDHLRMILLNTAKEFWPKEDA